MATINLQTQQTFPVGTTTTASSPAIPQGTTNVSVMFVGTSIGGTCEIHIQTSDDQVTWIEKSVYVLNGTDGESDGPIFGFKKYLRAVVIVTGGPATVTISATLT